MFLSTRPWFLVSSRRAMATSAAADVAAAFLSKSVQKRFEPAAIARRQLRVLPKPSVAPPKRGRTAYAIFVSEQFKTINALPEFQSLPTIERSRATIKRLSAVWKSYSAEDKKVCISSSGPCRYEHIQQTPCTGIRSRHLRARRADAGALVGIRWTDATAVKDAVTVKHRSCHRLLSLSMASLAAAAKGGSARLGPVSRAVDSPFSTTLLMSLPILTLSSHHRCDLPLPTGISPLSEIRRPVGCRVQGLQGCLQPVSRSPHPQGRADREGGRQAQADHQP
ncbi:uncharacterized protein BJ171DRAFT_154814 [Polychytrium aggregatum]|uniref:uncharacterized protein n=1 Tax=Polychytrium aggregatum TaxID=110093 RepID=UPI0022FF3B2E|nr:uncharacterized protein BJ171DRAFT_154814 [Polychytrium aggregatum]KAI9203206.1 hypothetical protein BJ171DRAFT_154814 [Polychytrium aggregatum]